MKDQNSPVVHDHGIESFAKVYLNFDRSSSQYTLSRLNFDGSPLEGPSPSCAHGRNCSVCATADGKKELDEALRTELPTGIELLEMLAAFAGLQLSIPAAPHGGGPVVDDPERLLARFQQALKEVDQRDEEYGADPDNQLSPSTTAKHVDSKAELHEEAAEAMAALDRHMQAGGRPPIQWAWSPSTTN